jgi:nucleotide-binding universal stress UspA family protein
MFSKLLVPLDGSSLAEQALGLAAGIARASHASIELVLVHEPAQYGDAAVPRKGEELEVELKYLDAIAAELASGATIPTTRAVVRGAPADCIRARAREIGADLIVMTSHGRTGLSRAWLGSVADAVARRSSIPVLITRPIEKTGDRLTAKPLFTRVLVPLDGSRLAAEVLEPAGALAQCSHATVILLRVVQPVPLVAAYDVNQPFAFPPPMPDMEATDRVVEGVVGEVEATARELRERAGVKVDAHVVVGTRVADEIIDFARAHDVDAIAMSTRGRGASRILLGSVADKLLRASGLPILLRRPAKSDEDPPLLTEADVAEQLPALSFP